MATRKRKRLARNIYEDANGISIFIGGSEKGNRFILGTDLDELIQTRDEREQAAALRAVPRRGTLKQDVATYLATLPEDVTTGVNRRRRRSDAETLLTHWLKATTMIHERAVAFRDLSRGAITPLMVKTQIAAWRSANVSESTCDKRRGELSLLYTALNGKAGYNPVRAVPKFNPTYDDPRGFDLAIMDTILDSMPDRGRPDKGTSLEDGTISTVNTSKIRLRVMRHCAIPPQTLKRVTPSDLDLRAGTLRIRTRQKGKGATGRVLPLSTMAVAALRVFVAHNLFGWFDQRAVNRAFKRAATRYRLAWKKSHTSTPCPIPEDLHAYDLRHCFLSDVFRKVGDKKTVGYLAGHADNSKSTDRYLQAAVDEVAKRAVALISKTISKTPKKSEKIPTNHKRTAPRAIA